MKKLISLFLAIFMILATVSASLADGTSTLNDDAVETDNKAVRFVKEIKVYNPENATVNEPTITYTYTVSASSSGKSITDKNGRTGLTKAGVVNGVRLSSQTSQTLTAGTSVTLAYTPNSGSTFTANSTGYANTKWVEIDFTNVNFGAAGIYRYKIQEAAESYTTSGVIEGDTGHARYLDVYVKDAETQSTTLDQPADWEIYGYALFTEDEDIDAKTGTVKETKKTTGFVSHTDGPDDTDAKLADQYYTFNLTIKKIVSNDSYTKSTHHQFPFTVTLANTAVTGKVLPIMSVSENATQTALDTAGIVIGRTEWTPKIADNATVSYVGIPTGTTINITETNDVTGTTYLVDFDGANNNPAPAAKAVYTGGTSETATVTVGATAGAAATANSNVTFENDLQDISPTGYFVRYAPYALMLIAGIALLLVAMKRRKHSDEE